MIELNEQFWTQRYLNNEAGWDLGTVSPPLKTYVDQLIDKSIEVLIPGCGNSHEGEYLLNSRFVNTNLIDISPEAINNIKERIPSFPIKQLHCENFFEHKGAYDLIVEQTFFCALDPSLRKDYAKKMSDLLVKGGKLVGVMFGVPKNEEHPPFGGSKEEYLSYFKYYFNIEIMEECYNSIKPRQGSELFVILSKK
jgi:SAM-dependent methyltransferase